MFVEVLTHTFDPPPPAQRHNNNVFEWPVLQCYASMFYEYMYLKFKKKYTCNSIMMMHGNPPHLQLYHSWSLKATTAKNI